MLDARTYPALVNLRDREKKYAHAAASHGGWT